MTTTLYTVVAGLALSAAAAAQNWQPVNGPYGGDFTALLADSPAGGLAAVANKVYRTDDLGQTWSQLGALGYQFSIRNFIAHQGVLIGINESQGAWRSTDSGKNWEALSVMPFAIASTDSSLFGSLGGYPVNTILRSTDLGTTWDPMTVPGDPLTVLSDGNTVYVSTATGMLRSTDQGQNWTNVGVPQASAMARAGGSLYVFSTDGPSMHRSLDGGLSWQPAGGGLPVGMQVRAMSAVGGDVVAAVYSLAGSEVYRAEGNQWVRIADGTGSGGGFVRSIGGWGSRMLLGTNSDLFASVDRGQTVTPSSTGVNSATFSVLEGSGEMLLAAKQNLPGLHRSFDGGQTWSQSAPIGRVWSLLIDQDAVLAGTADGGVFRTKDAGESWAPLNNGFPSYNVNGSKFETVQHIVRAPGVLYAGLSNSYVQQGPQSYYVSPGGLARSTNNGATWQRLSGFPIQGYNNQGQPIHRDTQALAWGAGALWAQTYGGLFRSTNGGDTWSLADSGLIICQSEKVQFGTMVEVNGEMLGGVHLCTCACGFPTAVYRWSAANSTWVPSSSGLPDMAVRQLLVHGTDVYAALGWGYGTEGPGTGLYKSSDGGKTWIRAADSALSVDLLAANTQGVFQATWNAGISKLVGAPCYANCDASVTQPVLNVADFGCFLTRFASGDAYANCDGSAAAPVLNVADFGCFLQKFATSCP